MSDELGDLAPPPQGAEIIAWAQKTTQGTMMTLMQSLGRLTNCRGMEDAKAEFVKTFRSIADDIEAGKYD